MHEIHSVSAVNSKQMVQTGSLRLYFSTTQKTCTKRTLREKWRILNKGNSYDDWFLLVGRPLARDTKFWANYTPSFTISLNFPPERPTGKIDGLMLVTKMPHPDGFHSRLGLLFRASPTLNSRCGWLSLWHVPCCWYWCWNFTKKKWIIQSSHQWYERTFEAFQKQKINSVERHMYCYWIPRKTCHRSKCATSNSQCVGCPLFRDKRPSQRLSRHQLSWEFSATTSRRHSKRQSAMRFLITLGICLIAITFIEASETQKLARFEIKSLYVSSKNVIPEWSKDKVLGAGECPGKRLEIEVFTALFCSLRS